MIDAVGNLGIGFVPVFPVSKEIHLLVGHVVEDGHVTIDDIGELMTLFDKMDQKQV